MDKLNRIKIILSAVLILLFGIFLGKNYRDVPVWIFGWEPQLPLIAIALGSFLLGGLCTWLLMVWHRKKGDLS